MKEGGFLMDLILHEFTWVAVAGKVTNREVYAFFDDKLVTADIGHHHFILIVRAGGAFVFVLDGIEQDIIGVFRESQEAELAVIEESVDEVELDKRLLTEQFGAIEQDLMIFKIVDV